MHQTDMGKQLIKIYCIETHLENCIENILLFELK